MPGSRVARLGIIVGFLEIVYSAAMQCFYVNHVPRNERHARKNGEASRDEVGTRMKIMLSSAMLVAVQYLHKLASQQWVDIPNRLPHVYAAAMDLFRTAQDRRLCCDQLISTMVAECGSWMDKNGHLLVGGKQYVPSAHDLQRLHAACPLPDEDLQLVPARSGSTRMLGTTTTSGGSEEVGQEVTSRQPQDRFGHGSSSRVQRHVHHRKTGGGPMDRPTDRASSGSRGSSRDHSRASSGSRGSSLDSRGSSHGSSRDRGSRPDESSMSVRSPGFGAALGAADGSGRGGYGGAAADYATQQQQRGRPGSFLHGAPHPPSPLGPHGGLQHLHVQNLLQQYQLQQGGMMPELLQGSEKQQGPAASSASAAAGGPRSSTSIAAEVASLLHQQLHVGAPSGGAAAAGQAGGTAQRQVQQPRFDAAVLEGAKQLAEQVQQAIAAVLQRPELVHQLQQQLNQWLASMMEQSRSHDGQ